jgi:ABC-type dipeptide/oligopeptide/nickel transport system permease component
VTAFVVRRLLWTVPLILVVMLVTFALMHGIGGSPFKLESGGVPFALQLRFERYYGLDDPFLVQFWHYVQHVFRFDFGPSLVDRYTTVDEVSASRSRSSSPLSPRPGRSRSVSEWASWPGSSATRASIASPPSSRR